jgi:hypothetical protein
VLNFAREYREGFLTVFWVQTRQKSSADALNDGSDESYLNLEFFLPDAPTVDVIITTRHVRVAEIMTLTTVDLEEIEITETMELSRKYAKLQSSGPDANEEVLLIVTELDEFWWGRDVALTEVTAKNDPSSS